MKKIDWCKSFFSKPKVVIIFLAAYIIAAIIMAAITFPLTFKDIFLAQVSIEKAILYYGQWYVADYMNKYRNGLIWDFAYIITYTGLLSTLLLSLSCKTNVKFRPLSVWNPALIAAGSDFIENIIDLFIVADYPTVLNATVQLRVYFSWVKWIAVGLSIIVIFILLAKFLFITVFSTKRK